MTIESMDPATSAPRFPSLSVGLYHIRTSYYEYGQGPLHVPLSGLLPGTLKPVAEHRQL